MHSIRLFSPRRLALLLLIGIPAITLVSVGQFLGARPDGVKVLKRDGSTITFDIPWKSALIPAIPNIKAHSPAANNDLKIAADALANGGVPVGETGVKDGSDSVSIVLKGVDGSITTIIKNPVNTAAGQGELVYAGTGLVDQVLSTVKSASNVGAINTTKPNSGPDASHASSHGCAMPTPPHLANSTSGAAKITPAPILPPTVPITALPMMTSGCQAAPTVTETWHSTHYAETATMYSFMSIMTVTCTETVAISLCPSSSYLAPNNMTSPSQPTAMVQCANGSFVMSKEYCPPMMMNNSTSPGPPKSPCYPYSECKSGEFCPPQFPAQSCLCGVGWACADCSGGWYCPPSATSIPAPTLGGNDSNGISSSNSSVSLPSLSISSVSRNITASPTGLIPSGRSSNGTILGSANITPSLAQPTFLPNSTASAGSNITTNAVQPTLSANGTNSLPTNATSGLSNPTDVLNGTNMTSENATSSLLQPTLLPNNTGSTSGNGPKPGNVTSLLEPQPSSVPSLNGTVDLLSDAPAILATNASVVLPTRIGNVISSPSVLLPTTNPPSANLTGNSATSPLPGVPSIPLTSAPAPQASPIIGVPNEFFDYGARVQQGVESGVRGALSNIDGLTGNLLDSVLAGVNSVLAVAIQTAAPVPGKVAAVLSVLPIPDVNNIAAVLPTASQSVNNIANVVAGGAAALTTPIPVASGLAGGLLPTVSQVVDNVLSNTPGAVGVIASSAPAVNGFLGGLLPTGPEGLTGIATPSVILNNILPTSPGVLPAVASPSPIVVGSVLPTASPLGNAAVGIAGGRVVAAPNGALRIIPV